MQHKVFVYGSLLSGMPNHDHMGSSKLVSGKARTKHATFLLLDLMEFPFPSAVSWSGIGNRIIGEVYEVSDERLLLMDIFEGHPDFFKRETVQIELESGEVMDCEMYLGPYAEAHGKIRSGDWRKWHIADRMSMEPIFTDEYPDGESWTEGDNRRPPHV